MSLSNEIESKNEDRREIENTDILVAPSSWRQEWWWRNEVNIYENKMCKNVSLAVLLGNSSIWSRSACHALLALGLILRLHQVIENTAPETAYELTAFDIILLFFKRNDCWYNHHYPNDFSVQYLYGFTDCHWV